MKKLKTLLTEANVRFCTRTFKNVAADGIFGFFRPKFKEWVDIIAEDGTVLCRIREGGPGFTMEPSPIIQEVFSKERGIKTCQEVAKVVRFFPYWEKSYEAYLNRVKEAEQEREFLGREGALAQAKAAEDVGLFCGFGQWAGGPELPFGEGILTAYTTGISISVPVADIRNESPENVRFVVSVSTKHNLEKLFKVLETLKGVIEDIRKVRK
jgi:hypothetical protein